MARLVVKKKKKSSSPTTVYLDQAFVVHGDQKIMSKSREGRADDRQQERKKLKKQKHEAGVRLDCSRSSRREAGTFLCF